MADGATVVSAEPVPMKQQDGVGPEVVEEADDKGKSATCCQRFLKWDGALLVLSVCGAAVGFAIGFTLYYVQASANALVWVVFAEMASQRYTQEHVERAVELVRAKQMSLNGTSKAFGIPYATLGGKVRGRRPMKAAPKTVLSEEERKLVDWLKELSRRGFGRAKDDLKDTVKKILDARGTKTVFKENRPRKDWMLALFKRHPEVGERMGRALGRERAVVTKDGLAEWFRQMKEYLDAIDPSLLTSPERIFNADESGFNVCPKTKKIISVTGAKHVYSVTSGTRQQVTVLACSSALGHFIPPLLIFPYSTDPRFNALGGFDRAFFQKTQNGWITEDVFLSYLRDVFIPNLGTAAFSQPF